ncbi:MAG: phage tail protein [Scytolyngbya sp. HA4215-MV1]|jgi:phage tail-like protein|nr:phage tail protein [Scytolyngbya sp. HA4215-MV1]
MTVPQYELLTNSKYYLELTLEGSQDVIDAYFMECQGFKRSQEVISVCEVTHQKWGRKNATMGRILRTKLPGNSKSENIILKQGLCVSDTFWKWFKAVEEGKWGEQRRDGDLTIYSQGNDIQARFRFYRAWPVSYKISDVKAAASEFELEEVELAVEGFVRADPISGKEIQV